MSALAPTVNPFIRNSDSLSELLAQTDAYSVQTPSKASTNKAVGAIQIKLPPFPDKVPASEPLRWEAIPKEKKITILQNLLKNLNDLISTKAGRNAILRACKSERGDDVIEYLREPNLVLLKIYALSAGIETELAELKGLKCLRKGTQVLLAFAAAATLALGIVFHFKRVGQTPSEALAMQIGFDFAPMSLSLVSSALYFRKTFSMFHVMVQVAKEKKEIFSSASTNAVSKQHLPIRIGKVKAAAALSFLGVIANGLAYYFLDRFSMTASSATAADIMKGFSAGGFIVGLALLPPLFFAVLMLCLSQRSIFGHGLGKFSANEFSRPLLPAHEGETPGIMMMTPAGRSAAATAGGGGTTDNAGGTADGSHRTARTLSLDTPGIAALPAVGAPALP